MFNRKEEEKKARHMELRILFCTLLVVGIIVAVNQYSNYSITHFNSGTYINGVECSYLTVEEASQKIEEINQGKITFTVVSADQNGNIKTNSYETHTKELGVKVDNPKEIEEALKKQKEGLNRLDIIRMALKNIVAHFVPTTDVEQITINGLCSVDSTKIKGYLETIPELQKQNMREPENAYLMLNGDTLQIVPEKQGNVVNVEEAVQYAKDSIEQGKYQIDFSTITKIEPEITSENSELILNMSTINSYLSKKIVFELNDEAEVTLDSSITKNWLKKQEDGTFTLDVESNISEFLDMLEEEANKVNQSVTFFVGDNEEVTVAVEQGKRPKLDRESITSSINHFIYEEEGEIYEKLNPSYADNKNLGSEVLKTYIALDITKQTVWAYKDGEQILQAPCVTGNVSNNHGTPTGIYYLSYKTTNATLKGYNSDGSKYASFVNFWMPFNNGIGFHDASWRHGVFGGEIYKTNGSHGCVNMLYDDAKTLYDFIDTSIPIIVYES